MSESIAERVKNLVAENLSVEKNSITAESRFNEDLNADSLDTVELVMALEKEFGCEIPDEDSDKIKTVGDAISYLETLAQAGKLSSPTA